MNIWGKITHSYSPDIIDVFDPNYKQPEWENKFGINGFFIKIHCIDDLDLAYGHRIEGWENKKQNILPSDELWKIADYGNLRSILVIREGKPIMKKITVIRDENTILQRSEEHIILDPNYYFEI